MIKSILFDVDGVLINSFEANHKYFCDLLSYCGYTPFTKDEHKALFHCTMRDIIRHATKSLDDQEVERVYQIGNGTVIEYDKSLLSMPEMAPEVLELLHNEYKLGIVTSRQRDVALEGPRNNLSHIKHCFTAIVALEDTVNHKPHPEPLFCAAKKIGVLPDECAYVGDTESDMKAARGAGMKFIHYSKTPSPQADAGTYDFRELMGIVKSFS